MADRYLLESGAPDGYLLEDGTGVLLMEPFVPNTESDDWWSGSALNFAAVAVVGAAALLASNTAIARTFVHQDEVPPPAATPASATSSIIPTQRARISPVFQQWFAQDELPSQAAAPSVEEVYDWKPLVPVSALFGATPQWDDQALSWSIDEQYSWTPGWVLPTTAIRVETSWHQDDVPVQPASFVPGEDTTAPAQTAVFLSASMGLSPNWADEVLSWYIDEQYEWTPKWVAPQVSTLPFFDSDALPTALDEEAWSTPVVSPQKAIALLTFTDDEYAPLAAIADDPWVLFGFSTAVKPSATLWSVEDERIVLAAFTPHEDDAASAVVIASNPNIVVWATDEEIVPQASATSVGGGVLRERVNVVRWYQGDDLPIAVATTPQFEDDSWTVVTPAAPQAKCYVWVVDDTWTAPAVFTPNDDDVQPSVFVAANPNVVVWAANEEIAVASVLAFEDDTWTALTPEPKQTSRYLWNVEEDFVPQLTFGLEDFEPPLFVPALVKANAPLWFGDDERVTFVAPTPTFEDDSWNILRSVPVNLAPYFAMLFQGSTDDGSIVVTEPPPPPTGTHTWLLVKRRTRR